MARLRRLGGSLLAVTAAGCAAPPEPGHAFFTEEHRQCTAHCTTAIAVFRGRYELDRTRHAAPGPASGHRSGSPGGASPPPAPAA